jgi:hypothetical protein
VDTVQRRLRAQRRNGRQDIENAEQLGNIAQGKVGDTNILHASIAPKHTFCAMFPSCKRVKGNLANARTGAAHRSRARSMAALAATQPATQQAIAYIRNALAATDDMGGAAAEHSDDTEDSPSDMRAGTTLPPQRGLKRRREHMTGSEPASLPQSLPNSLSTLCCCSAIGSGSPRRRSRGMHRALEYLCRELHEVSHVPRRDSSHPRAHS